MRGTGGRALALLALAPLLVAWTPVSNASKTPDNSARPTLGFAGDVLHVFWEERGEASSGQPRVWTSRRQGEGWTAAAPAFPAQAAIQQAFPRLIPGGAQPLLCATFDDDEVRVGSVGPEGVGAMEPLSQSPGRRSYACAGSSNGQAAVVAWHDNPASGPSEWEIHARRRPAAGAAWGERKTLSGAIAGINSDAMVAVDAAGDAHVVFLNKTDSFIYYVAWPAGGEPSPAQALTAAAARRFWPAIALDGDGVVVAWQEAPLGTDQWHIRAQRRSASGWSPSADVSAPETGLNPRLAASPKGGALLAFRVFGKHEFRASKVTSGVFAPPEPIATFGKAAGEAPDLTFDRFGNGWAVLQARESEATDWDTFVSSAAPPDPCLGVACGPGAVCSAGQCQPGSAGAGGQAGVGGGQAGGAAGQGSGGQAGISGSSGQGCSPGAGASGGGGSGGAGASGSAAAGVGGGGGSSAGGGGSTAGGGGAGGGGKAGSEGKGKLGGDNEAASDEGGCGCRAGGGGSGGAGAAALLGLLALGRWRRRAGRSG